LVLRDNFPAACKSKRYWWLIRQRFPMGWCAECVFR